MSDVIDNVSEIDSIFDDDFDDDDWDENVHRCISDPHLIVVASEGLDVSKHAGYCTNFNYYRVENYSIVNSQNLPAKGKVNKRFAEIFAPLGVDVVIVNDISPEAEKDFTSRDIAIARGASGRAIDAAQDFLDGMLKVTLPDPA